MSESSPKRVPLNFKRLLDVILEKNVQESALVDRLITFPHRVRVFVSTGVLVKTFYKAVLYIEAFDSDGVAFDSGGVVFDSGKHMVHTQARELDEIVQTLGMQRVTPKQLAENWNQHRTKQTPTAVSSCNKLQLRWLEAMLHHPSFMNS